MEKNETGLVSLSNLVYMSVGFLLYKNSLEELISRCPCHLKTITSLGKYAT